MVFDGFVTLRWGVMGHVGPLYPAFSLFLIDVRGSWGSLLLASFSAPSSPAVQLRVKYWLLAMPRRFRSALRTSQRTTDYPFCRLAAWETSRVVVLAYAAVRHRVMDIDALHHAGCCDPACQRRCGVANCGRAHLASSSPRRRERLFGCRLPAARSPRQPLGVLALPLLSRKQEVESSLFPVRARGA